MRAAVHPVTQLHGRTAKAEATLEISQGHGARAAAWLRDAVPGRTVPQRWLARKERATLPSARW